MPASSNERRGPNGRRLVKKTVTFEQRKAQLSKSLNDVIRAWKADRERHGIHGRRKVEKGVASVLKDLTV